MTVLRVATSAIKTGGQHKMPDDGTRHNGQIIQGFACSKPLTALVDKMLQDTKVN